MLKLPSVTLICLTNQNFADHLLAMERSSLEIEFGARKIIYDMECDSIEKWNEKIIKDLYKYVDTTHALLIHSDGYVIHPELWRDDWLQYDWCSSPWPLPSDNYSYRDEERNIVRVGNSVGLRSKKLLELGATRLIKYRYGNNSEDGHYCCHNREWLESQGCKFMPFEEAIYFGKEHTIPENENIEKTFLFHAI